MAKKIKAVSWEKFSRDQEKKKRGARIINFLEEKDKRNRLSKKEVDGILSRRKK